MRRNLEVIGLIIRKSLLFYNNLEVVYLYKNCYGNFNLYQQYTHKPVLY